jgi:radical SAM superfamily enzyme YgiQ (UPF0313 family)
MQKKFVAFVQNTSLNLSAHVIGFKYVCPEKEREYPAGTHRLLSAQIHLYEDDSLLDEKIEAAMREFLNIRASGEGQRRIQNKLKFLLVNLPWQRDGFWGVRAGSRWPHIKDRSEGRYLPFPFFLAYATSLLEKHDIEVKIIDAIAQELTEKDFLSTVVSLNFDYIVVETSVPSFAEDLRQLGILAKSGIKVILCGPNSEIFKEEFLQRHPYIEFVLKGEYEITLLDLIKALQEDGDLSKVAGIIFRDNNRVISTPSRSLLDVNLLPWPHRETLPMARYWDLPGNIPYPSVQMLASRGCPFNCSFCLWPQVMYQGNHYRARDIDDVVSEMEFLVKKMKFKSVYFDDDTFNIGKERMLEFAAKIKEKGLQNIPWAIMARADLMDEEILVALKSAGLFAVKYGVESCVPHFIKDCNKNLDLTKADKMIKFTKELGIKIHLTFAFGFAGETRDSIDDTVQYGMGLDPDSVQFSILTPFPGTRLFDELETGGRISTYDWSLYDGHSHCVFNPENLSAKDLVEEKNRAYIVWGEHVRSRRGLRGDIKRFGDYLKEHGLAHTLSKTVDYLNFVLIRKNKYLNGKNR